ncbi:class I glutamine amidotransferase-like protein [Xylogone sp. PMI_703]|nr:class I glutamine amidotransferase-like protein [Xylogone sp. PMI_703]
MAPIHFGSLVYDYQAIDVIGPLDLINSGSKSILKALTTFIPISDEVIDRAPEFVFHHIGLTLDPVPLLTSGVILKPTTTIDDCPELDYLLVAGPSLEDFKTPPRYAEFIRKHVAAGKVVFTNCTGAGVLASTGVLDGKNATINNIEYHWTKKLYPKVNWTKDNKWVIDGNIWTASGAAAGMDMFSYWFKENFGMDLLILATAGLDYEPRDIDGLFNVLPQRYDANGKHISTHVFH